MASSWKWCTVCHSRFRGSPAVHASTAKHRHNLQPKRRSRATVNAALGIRRAHVRRAIAGDQGQDMERVRKHRRRPPNDGPRFTVPVHRYWRRRAWSGWAALRAAARRVAA